MPEQQQVKAENYLAPETLVQLAPFELRAKMIVEGVMSGMHRSPYHGMAVEFAEHRQYVAGDDPKHLDWKVFGRTDKLYIKQYQQETNLDVILLIDASASMGYGTLEVKKDWGGTTASNRISRWTKFDHATALGTAASLAFFRSFAGRLVRWSFSRSIWAIERIPLPSSSRRACRAFNRAACSPEIPGRRRNRCGMRW